MLTSESDPSLTETAPSTSRSESSDNVTCIFDKQNECTNTDDGSKSDNAPFNEYKMLDNDQPLFASTPISQNNNLTYKYEPKGLDLINNKIEQIKQGYWDSLEEDEIVDNSKCCKDTVLLNPSNDCITRDDHDEAKINNAQMVDFNMVDNGQPQIASTPNSRKIINDLTSNAESMVLDSSNNRVEHLQQVYWDSSDEDAFVDNSRRRKITVIMNPNDVENSLSSKRRNIYKQYTQLDNEILRDQYKRISSEEVFSQDSLEVGNRNFSDTMDSVHSYEFYGEDNSWDDSTSDEFSSNMYDTKRQHFKSEVFIV